MLTRNNVIELFKAITAGRHRTVGEPDLVLWRTSLTAGGVDSLPDAMQAVAEFYAESTEWIQPAHVVRGVREIRARRLKAAPTDEAIMADVDPDDPRFFSELTRRREALASGKVAGLRAVRS